MREVTIAGDSPRDAERLIERWQSRLAARLADAAPGLARLPGPTPGQAEMLRTLLAHLPVQGLERGPRPLPLHLALALGGWSSLLQELSAPAEAAAVAAAVPRRIDEFLRGVERYWRAPRPPWPGGGRVVWRHGHARLLLIGEEVGAPVLLIPSLINKWHVFDLREDFSFARSLTAAGFTVFVLDWGTADGADQDETLETLVAGPLAAAAEAVTFWSGQAPGVVGYCMGGTLAAALAARRADLVAALILVAAPWDFHAERMPPAGASRFAARWFQALAADGLVPVDALQAAFVFAAPFHVIDKFRRFARLHRGSDREAQFVAVEDWLNDGSSLTRRMMSDIMGHWYVENRPGQGRWRVDGRRVELGRIGCPTLVCVPDSDRLVAPGSATIAARLVPGAELWRQPTGHIGLMLSPTAPARLWAPVAAWLQTACCGGATATSPCNSR